MHGVGQTLAQTRLADVGLARQTYAGQGWRAGQSIFQNL